jgi:hypothetical protein
LAGWLARASQPASQASRSGPWIFILSCMNPTRGFRHRFRRALPGACGVESAAAVDTRACLPACLLPLPRFCLFFPFVNLFASLHSPHEHLPLTSRLSQRPQRSSQPTLHDPAIVSNSQTGPFDLLRSTVQRFFLENAH